MNWLGLECAKCHKRQKFPNATMAETCGWCQVNGSWYCYGCDFNGGEEDWQELRDLVNNGGKYWTDGDEE